MQISPALRTKPYFIEAGFTLLELLIGIVLFGVLSIRSINFNLV
jgi:prepilin-type N-terminal cleavage/methylation domain-containing protein